MLGHRQQDFEDHGSPPRKGKGKTEKGRKNRECKIGVARQFEKTQEGLQLTRSKVHHPSCSVGLLMYVSGDIRVC